MTDEEKRQVWDRYWQRRPLRVPVRLSTNPRIVLSDPALNPDRVTYEQFATDPRAHLQISLRHQLHLRTSLNHYTDGPTSLPDTWDVGLSAFNIYEAAYFGAAVHYPTDQVPATEPILTDSNKHSIFDIDIDRPLENPFMRDRLTFWKEMEAICRDLRFEGRPVRLQPWCPASTDGPVTVGCNLRGAEFLMDLIEDPDYADRLMSFIIRAAIQRRTALWGYWGDRVGKWNGMADDSIATLSTDMVRDRLVPLYREFYQTADAALPQPASRGIHLCGDATRHFPLLQQELGITSFDTGFPVNHARLRKQLGPNTEISGGPEVTLLLAGTPAQVYDRTRDILVSGVKEGGRFILQEANNLPPRCPPANLEAMYAANLEFGRYP